MTTDKEGKKVTYLLKSAKGSNKNVKRYVIESKTGKKISVKETKRYLFISSKNGGKRHYIKSGKNIYKIKKN